MHITFSEHLKGRTVIDGQGQVVGTLEEILIDAGNWQVEAFRVRLTRDVGRELHAKSGIFHPAAIDVPRALVQAAGDAIILAASRSELQSFVAVLDEPAPATAEEAADQGPGRARGDHPSR